MEYQHLIVILLVVNAFKQLTMLWYTSLISRNTHEVHYCKPNIPNLMYGGAQSFFVRELSYIIFNYRGSVFSGPR